MKISAVKVVVKTFSAKAITKISVVTNIVKISVVKTQFLGISAIARPPFWARLLANGTGGAPGPPPGPAPGPDR